MLSHGFVRHFIFMCTGSVMVTFSSGHIEARQKDKTVG